MFPTRSILGQGQMSRSNFFPKWVKYETTGHIFDAISPTDFIISIITAFCDSFGHWPLVLNVSFSFFLEKWDSQSKGEVMDTCLSSTWQGSIKQEDGYVNN